MDNFVHRSGGHEKNGDYEKLKWEMRIMRNIIQFAYAMLGDGGGEGCLCFAVAVIFVDCASFHCVMQIELILKDYGVTVFGSLSKNR